MRQPQAMNDRLNAPTPVIKGRPEEQYQEDYFVYGVGPVTVAAGASAQGSIQIQADSRFLWKEAVYYADIANAAFTDTSRPIPNVTVQIVDTGSGRQLFSQATPIASVFGTGLLPFLLPQERYFQPNSQVQFQFANFDAAVTYNIRLSLIGSKQWKFG